MINVEGGNRGASGGRVAMAATGVIQKGTVVVADGSFLEISPPVLTLPETLHLGYRTANSIVSRIVVSTRPNNLTAYWPMDEGSGVFVEDLIGGNDGSLIGGAELGGW